MRVGTGFPSGQTRSVCPEIMLNRKIERDDDSKKSHPALDVTGVQHLGNAIVGAAEPPAQLAIDIVHHQHIG